MTPSSPTSFDDFLDRLLGGEDVDSDSFLRAHPELSDEERRQISLLCKPRASDADSAGTTAGGAATDAPPIARLGNFRLGKRIGAGGMGAVFAARDESLEREVAVKIVGPDLVANGEGGERFLREVRAVARLRHPNIVTVYAAGEDSGLRYMAMELVDGHSLHEVIVEAATTGARIAVADVVRFGSEIARALEAAHEAGIIHRDVKPSNIRIATDGRAVLLDFGLAREAGAMTLTESGAFRGSPQYASPEQVGIANVSIDARTDIYSLGATLYEALTGVAPFRAQTREQLFHQILCREPVPLRRLEPSLPKDLETVILATLEKDPGRRHSTAAALAGDLEAIRDGRPVSVRPISAFGRMLRWARRRPAAAALVSAMIIGVPVVAALGGFIVANLPKIAKATATERTDRLGELLNDAFLEHGEGDPVNAHDLFEAALRLHPDSPEANAGYALNRLELEDPASAIAFLDMVAPRFGSGNWMTQIRIEALEHLRRTEDAKALSSSVGPQRLAIDHFVAGMLALSRFHRSDSRPAADLALEHLGKAALGTARANPLYHYELGHAAWHASRRDEARAIAAAIENLWPPSPERWFAIGRTLRDAQPDASYDALAKATSPPPRSVPATHMIVAMLSDSENIALIDRAHDLARRLVAEHPMRARSHQALGSALMGRKDYGAAIDAFTASIRIDPDSSGAYTGLAQAFVSSGEDAKAVAAARKSISIRKGEPRAWKVLGAALLSLDEFDEAATVHQKALAFAPDDPSVLCNSGRSLLRIGEFTKARDQLMKGHEIGSARASWKHPSKKWVANAERLVAMETRLGEVRRGAGAPPKAAERVNLAREICTPQKRFAEGALLFASAFDAEPVLMARRAPPILKEAAAVSLAAGLGRGIDPIADAAKRAEMRERARGWFEHEIAACEQIRRDAEGIELIAPRLEPWTKDPTLVGTRQPGALREFDAWRPLWDRYDTLLGSAESRAAASR